MVSPQRLYEVLDHVIGFEKDLVGKRLLISAGPTREALDPVRFLTNHPSGRMGYAIAGVAASQGRQ